MPHNSKATPTLLLLSEKAVDREVLAHLARELGLSLSPCKNLEELLDRFEPETLSAILLDTQMRDGKVMIVNSVVRGLGWQGPVLGVGSQREPFISFGLNDVLETPLDINNGILKLGRWIGHNSPSLGLPIIDWQIALEAFGSDKLRYQGILSSFTSEFRDFEAQWDLSDREKSIAQIHNLAGASGGLRLKRVHSLAQVTEQLLSEESSSSLLMKMRHQVLQALQELFEVIEE